MWLLLSLWWLLWRSWLWLLLLLPLLLFAAVVVVVSECSSRGGGGGWSFGIVAGITLEATGISSLRFADHVWQERMKLANPSPQSH